MNDFIIIMLTKNIPQVLFLVILHSNSMKCFYFEEKETGSKEGYFEFPVNLVNG